MEDKIYLRITRDLEDSILSGKLREGDRVPSTQQVARMHDVNPATAARGVAVLTGRGHLIPKRGVGLFVTTGAREQISAERRESFREETLKALLGEAKLLGISKRDMIAMIMGA